LLGIRQLLRFFNRPLEEFAHGVNCTAAMSDKTQAPLLPRSTGEPCGIAPVECGDRRNPI